MGLGCDTPSAPAPPPARGFPFTGLGGAYTLTLEIPAGCAATAGISNPRTYAATLSGPSTGGFLIRISGGGYPDEVAAGILQAGDILSWNYDDPPRCDGTPEPLPDGRLLMVCGDGGSDYTDTTITAQVPANVFITADGEQRKVCSGMHQFTFSRLTTAQ